MAHLYRLDIETFPNGAEQDSMRIGVFRSRQEAEDTARRYLREVPGFRDYACEERIAVVPLFGGEAAEAVWSYCGWNTDEDLNELDILDGAFYTTEQAARTAMEAEQNAHGREEWVCNRWVLGRCEWAEGFTREYPSGRQALTLHQVRDTLSGCVESRSICAVEFEYDDNKHYYFPVAVGERLFLGAEEDDFILDGFCVRRIRDVYEISDRVGIYQKIFEAEGLTRFDAPAVDISDWHSVFTSLREMGRNVIVEREYEDGFFWIGRIEVVAEDHVLLRHFDADGIWQEELKRIEYRDVTSVTFGSRYVDVFSKYV